MPFISFEGIDASGKTTQLKILAQNLLEQNLPTITTREAGGTELGKAIRNLVQDSHDLEIHPLSEALLYAADRAQHLSELVCPALAKNYFVLTDRYVDSSLAFQGAQLSMQLIRDINQLATGGLQTDLTILLDLPGEVAATRLTERGIALDRIEQRGTAYQERVRLVYLGLANEQPTRFLVLDARLSEKQLAELIWQEVSKRFINCKAY